MSSKLRNIFLNKKFYFSIGLLIVVAIITVLSINLFRINKLERAALTDFSDKILPYLDDIDYENEDYEADDISKYITFAMEYNFGENNKTEGSYDELNGITQKLFNYKIPEEEFKNGISSPQLAHKYVGFMYDKEKYTITRDYIDERLVTITPITVYIEKSAHKFGKNYTVTYQKYEFETPYKIIDYTATHDISIPDFKDYLEGKATAANLKRAVTKECAEAQGELKKEIKVTYTIKEDRLQVSKIE